MPTQLIASKNPAMAPRSVETLATRIILAFSSGEVPGGVGSSVIRLPLIVAARGYHLWFLCARDPLPIYRQRAAVSRVAAETARVHSLCAWGLRVVLPRRDKNDRMVGRLSGRVTGSAPPPTDVGVALREEMENSAFNHHFTDRG